jgi:DNA-binding protein HU-beta
MKKAELISQVVKDSGGVLNKQDTALVLDAAFGVIEQAIRDDTRFAWPGFGTFTVRERAARKGRNPQTGKEIKIKAGKTVAFKPALSLKEGL